MRRREKKAGEDAILPLFPGKARGSLFGELVESQVEFKHVDARLAKKAEGAPGSVLLNELAHLRLAETARLGDTRGA